MNINTRNTILSTLATYNGVDSFLLVDALGKKNLTERFDNSVMRYVRRLRERGYVKRSVRGYYSLTARGRKFVNKTLSI